MKDNRGTFTYSTVWSHELHPKGTRAKIAALEAENARLTQENQIYEWSSKVNSKGFTRLQKQAAGSDILAGDVLVDWAADEIDRLRSLLAGIEVVALNSGRIDIAYMASQGNPHDTAPLPAAMPRAASVNGALPQEEA